MDNIFTDPRYLALSQAEQNALSKRYFAEVVSTDERYKALEPEQKQAINTRFNNDYYSSLQQSGKLPKDYDLVDTGNGIKPVKVQNLQGHTNFITQGFHQLMKIGFPSMDAGFMEVPNYLRDLYKYGAKAVAKTSAGEVNIKNPLNTMLSSAITTLAPSESKAIDNGISKLHAVAQDTYKSLPENSIVKKGDEKGFFKLMKEGSFGKAVDLLSRQSMESAPLSALAMASTIAGVPTVGLYAFGASAGGTDYLSTEGSSLSQGARLIHAPMIGTFEGWSETWALKNLTQWMSIGKRIEKDVAESTIIPLILKDRPGYFKLVAKDTGEVLQAGLPLERAKNAVIDITKNATKERLKSYIIKEATPLVQKSMTRRFLQEGGKQLGIGTLEQGSQEFVNGMAEDATDYIIKRADGNRTAKYDILSSLENGFNAFMVGAFSSVSQTAPVGIGYSLPKAVLADMKVKDRQNAINILANGLSQQKGIPVEDALKEVNSAINGSLADTEMDKEAPANLSDQLEQNVHEVMKDNNKPVEEVLNETILNPVEEQAVPEVVPEAEKVQPTEEIPQAQPIEEVSPESKSEVPPVQPEGEVVQGSEKPVIMKVSDLEFQNNDIKKAIQGTGRVELFKRVIETGENPSKSYLTAKRFAPVDDLESFKKPLHVEWDDVNNVYRVHDGNHRLMALKELGIEDYPVIIDKANPESKGTAVPSPTPAKGASDLKQQGQELSNTAPVLNKINNTAQFKGSTWKETIDETATYMLDNFDAPIKIELIDFKKGNISLGVSEGEKRYGKNNLQELIQDLQKYAEYPVSLVSSDKGRALKTTFPKESIPYLISKLQELQSPSTTKYMALNDSLPIESKITPKSVSAVFKKILGDIITKTEINGNSVTFTLRNGKIFRIDSTTGIVYGEEGQKAAGKINFKPMGNLYALVTISDSYNSNNHVSYHEGFHLVYKMLLTDQERTLLMEKYNYNEETMAEAFAHWMIAKDKSYQGVSGIFRKLWDGIKSIIAQLTDKSYAFSAENVFRNIRNAKYTSMDTTENRVVTAVARGLSVQYKQVLEEYQRQYDAVVKQYKGTDTWMKAPNGKDTNLNERQWVQVRTPAFKEWFGDWENDPKNASKVVDENGEPLVVYHGTSAEDKFTVFNISKQYSGEGASQSGSGMYFTTDEKSGHNYSIMKENEHSRVYSVFLNIKNPLEIDFNDGELTGMKHNFTRKEIKDIIMELPDIKDRDESPLSNWGDIEYEGFNKVLNDAIDSYYTSQTITALRNDLFNDISLWLYALNKATKFDGVVSNLENGIRHYVAWFSNEIKSATDNIGTFDANNPDIRYMELPTKTDEAYATASEQVKENKEKKPVLESAYTYYLNKNRIQERLANVILTKKEARAEELKAIKEDIKKFFYEGFKHNINIPEEYQEAYVMLLNSSDFTMKQVERAMRQAGKMEGKKSKLLDKFKGKDFTKTDINSIIKAVDSMTTLKGLNKTFELLTKIYDQSVGKKVNKYFIKALSDFRIKAKSIKRASDINIKLSPEATEEINRIYEISHLTGDKHTEFQAYLQDMRDVGSTPELIEANRIKKENDLLLYSMFYNYHGKNLSAKLEGYCYLKNLIEKGKSVFRQNRDSNMERWGKKVNTNLALLNNVTEKLNDIDRRKIERRFGQGARNLLLSGLNLETMFADLDRNSVASVKDYQDKIRVLTQNLSNHDQDSEEYSNISKQIEAYKQAIIEAKKVGEFQGWWNTNYFEPLRQALNVKFANTFNMKRLIQAKFAQMFDVKDTSIAFEWKLTALQQIKPNIIYMVNGIPTKSAIYDIQQIAYIYAQSLNPKMTQTLLNSGITADTLKEIEAYLNSDETGKKVKKWVHWVVEEFYPMYYQTINKVFKQRFGFDMIYEPTYTPLHRMYDEETIKEVGQGKDYYSELTGMFIDSMIARVDSTKPINMTYANFTWNLMNHISEMEHFKALAMPMYEIRNTLLTTDVLNSIENKYGRKFRKVLVGYMNDVASGHYMRQNHVSILDTLYSRFASSKIGLNLKVGLKQISSTVAFMVYSDNPVQFLKNLARVPLNAKTIARIMSKSLTWKQRYHFGINFEQQTALENKSRTAWINIANQILLDRINPTVGGDKIANMTGGGAYLLTRLDKYLKAMSKEKAEELALRDFELAVERTQQSSNPLYIPDMNREGVWRYFTQFQSQLFTYMNVLYNTIQNGKVGVNTKIRTAKQLSDMLLAVPFVYLVFSSFFIGMGGDLWKILYQILKQDLQNIPIAGAYTSYAIDKITGLDNPYAYNMMGFASSPVDAIDGFKKALKTANDEAYPDDPKFWKILIGETLKANEGLTGIPFRNIINTPTGWKDFLLDNDRRFGRLLGATEKSLDKIEESKQ